MCEKDTELLDSHSRHFVNESELNNRNKPATKKTRRFNNKNKRKPTFVLTHGDTKVSKTPVETMKVCLPNETSSENENLPNITCENRKSDTNMSEEIDVIVENIDDKKCVQRSLRPRKNTRFKNTKTEKDTNNSASTSRGKTSNSNSNKSNEKSNGNEKGDFLISAATDCIEEDRCALNMHGAFASAPSSSSRVDPNIGHPNLNVSVGETSLQGLLNYKRPDASCHGENIEACLIRAETDLGHELNADSDNSKHNGAVTDLRENVKCLKKVKKTCHVDLKSLSSPAQCFISLNRNTKPVCYCCLAESRKNISDTTNRVDVPEINAYFQKHSNNQKYSSVIPKETGPKSPFKQKQPKSSPQSGCCASSGKGIRRAPEKSAGLPLPSTGKVWITNISFPDIETGSWKSVSPPKSLTSISTSSKALSVESSRSQHKKEENNHSGKLPEEIVKALQKQASRSRYSLKGTSNSPILSDVAAFGKGLSCPPPENISATDYMQERLVMWKKKLLKKSKISPDGQRVKKKSAGIEGRQLLPYFKAYVKTEKYQKPVKETANTIKVIQRRSPVIKGEPLLHLDVKGYGSSSSSTPDIYDMYARKGKSKTRQVPTAPKPEPILKVDTLNTNLAEVNKPPCALYKQQHTPFTFHAVGYLSGGKTSVQKKKWIEISSDEKIVKHSYSHSNFTAAKNLPFNSQLPYSDRENACLNKNTSCPGVVGNEQCVYQKSPSHETKRQGRNSYVPSFPAFSPGQKVKSPPAYGPSIQENETEKMEKLDTVEITLSQSVDSDKTKEAEETENTNSGYRNKQRLSLMDKMTTFVHNISSARDSQTKGPLPNIEMGELLVSDTVNQTFVQTNTYLSRIQSQLYFKVPGDDNVMPVQGSVLIPGNAEFYFLSDAGALQKAGQETQSEKEDTDQQETDEHVTETDMNLDVLLKTSVHLDMQERTQQSYGNVRALIENATESAVKNQTKGHLVKTCLKEIRHDLKNVTKADDYLKSARGGKKESKSKTGFGSNQVPEAESSYKEGHPFSQPFVDKKDSCNVSYKTQKNKPRPKSSAVRGPMFEVVEKPRPRTSCYDRRTKTKPQGKQNKRAENAKSKSKSLEVSASIKQIIKENSDIDKRRKQVDKNESTDCNYQIYSALRRLSIRKSPIKSSSSTTKQTTGQRWQRSNVENAVNKIAVPSGGRKLANKGNTILNKQKTKVGKAVNKAQSARRTNMKTNSYKHDSSGSVKDNSEMVIVEKEIPQNKCYVSPEKLKGCSTSYDNDVVNDVNILEDVQTLVEAECSVLQENTVTAEMANDEKYTNTDLHHAESETEGSPALMKQSEEASQLTEDQILPTTSSIDVRDDDNLETKESAFVNDETMLKYLGMPCSNFSLEDECYKPYFVDSENGDKIIIVSNAAAESLITDAGKEINIGKSYSVIEEPFIDELRDTGQVDEYVSIPQPCFSDLCSGWENEIYVSNDCYLQCENSDLGGSDSTDEHDYPMVDLDA